MLGSLVRERLWRLSQGRILCYIRPVGEHARVLDVHAKDRLDQHISKCEAVL